ncbi:MAG: YrhK family protein [Rhizobiaceae bacterium]|nr:YrhK family protein [Rhizobiaceae bacterium]
MSYFNPENRTRSKRNRRLYAAYEIGYTAVDFAAALLFLIGSILFYSQATQTVATTMFVFGSVFFALKPTLRLVREIHYAAIGNLDDLAKRAEG